MLIKDDVYGPVVITEPVLLDLLQSNAVQRLAGVSQAGAASLVRSGRSCTRLEHSVGVMLLVRRLGGHATEQAAGLLHDVSHTAFSHTVDYVFGDRKQEFHEDAFETVFEASDLPSILRSHGLSWENLSTSECMQRVDADAPLLCADRIDYTLRDLLRFGKVSPGDVTTFLNDIEFIDGLIACRHIEGAKRFAEWYRFLVEQMFMHPLELYANDELGRILREALKRRVIDVADLFGTDASVLVKLRADESLALQLDDMTASVLEGTGANTHGRRIYSKARIVDPPVLSGGKITPLSRLLPTFNEMWENIRRIGREGLMIAGTPI